MKQIPNAFTLLNLFAGCLAIVFALQTDTVIFYLNDQYNSSFNIPEKLSWAAICILVAALIDFLDGFVARLFKATSEIGKQLDSLSDLVSFGVAPSVIVYQLLRFSFARQENGLNVSIFWLLPSFLLACAAAYRLARFNLDGLQQYSFKGVPVPAAGLVVASLPLILHFNYFTAINTVVISKWFLYGLVLVLGYLMLSRHRMAALKFTDFTFRNNKSKIILLLVAIIAALFLHWIAIPVIFVIYVVLSLTFPEKTGAKK